jgi:23S rRNA (cytidine1920-2'-O)/16S rRNA (cytidine1409-2'-O)-methyltransferase
MTAALAADPRVELREGVNARYLRANDFNEAFDLVVVDISFISLSLVIPSLVPLLHPSGDIVVLVKPQFEVGAERLGKGGIVRDEDARLAAVARVADAARRAGLCECGRMVSPILGMAGNQEYLLWLRKDGISERQ